ncbi:expressed protein [Phakopsora pachyrhizi]|uniref:Expressed protein n=1 Tax=Phakopsora pachyrhizi TaxID=170000 RepID=A0AAV0B4N5_PHAPC|nr:expressed protein [Phakopsora pachyrhizi]
MFLRNGELDHHPFGMFILLKVSKGIRCFFNIFQCIHSINIYMYIYCYEMRVFYYDFRNTDMKNDPAQFNSEKESGYTDASSSSHSSLNGSSNSDMNRKYTNVFNNFRSKDEEKAILKKEDQKNQLENNEKDFSVVNNPAPEDNLNYNSNNIMGGNHAKMVLDKEKNLERVAVNKPDLENFSKSSSNVEISSSSSIESEFDSQKEADKAEDHQKPEVKQSSQGGLYLPRYSRKKKPIKNSFYGYESSRQNGWKSHYKITKNLGFKTKYIPKNKHLDKKDELMLNDIHYENQNNGSKDDKISKLTTDYDSEKTLKLKEILGLENRQVSKESKDLLEDENTFINNSEGKRRKNTFITSLEDLKGNSEKADFLKNRISLKDDIKKTNIDSTDDSSHLQAHHNAGETSTNKMKQSDPQGTLEKNREPSTESKELFNKKSKEDEKIQIESTSTSDDKILPMMADSQLDPTKNQKTEHDMNQEKNFNRQDQKLAEEGEKKIEVSLSQKPELIISSNEDFPLLAEAIKTNKKNMLIEGEKKLKANKIYGAESSRNSALRNNYKNIKTRGLMQKIYLMRKF